ncbi:hypothetical protein ASF84_03735 [Pseudomonas sp. Leaf127]|nr:hypothetical protein ASF84_03735 [Pseudomonas sp. Leaf127]
MLQTNHSITTIFAAAGAGFVDSDSAKLRQQWLELNPYPLRQVFTGRVFQTGNVIEIVVIQALIQRLEDRFYLGKIPDPAGMRINRTRQMDADPERVPMQAPALMTFRDVGKAVCGLESKFLENFQNLDSINEMQEASLTAKT